MPSILSIPTAEIPFHFLCFPITQCETLLAHVLTHPHLSRALVETAFNQGNPVLQQLFPLFYSYVIVSPISFCLVVSLVFLEITKALDTGLSTACPAIFVLLVDQGLDRAMEQLHRDELRPYPFLFMHNPYVTLRQVLKKGWHDLALDHTMDSSFLFHCLVTTLFLGQNQDLDLSIYISDISPSDEQSLPTILLLIVSSTSYVSPFSRQSLLTILLFIVLSFSEPTTYNNLGTFLVHLSIVLSLRKAPIRLVYKPTYVFLCPLASSTHNLHSNLVSSLGFPLVPGPH